MTIKAALLDAPAASGTGVYLRIDELADESQLTERHVPTLTECDRPAGQYVWVPDSAVKPFGGTLWPISYLNRLAQDQAAVAVMQSRREQRIIVVEERKRRV